MRRTRIRTAVVVAGTVLTALLTPSASMASPEPDWTPDEPDVVLAQASDGKKLHFPNAERLDDGSIAVVAREGEDHIGQDGRLLMLTSNDRGRTWSSPHVVLDTPFDDRDPMITELSSGRLLLNWFQIDWSQTPPVSMGTFVAHSDDGGATWSEPVAVGTSMSGESDIVDTYELGWAASHGQIKELDDGSLLIPLYGTTPDDKWQRATVVRSNDGGETWDAASESLIGSEQGTHFQEPVLTVLPDGTMHVLLRIGASASTMGAARSQEAWSYDGGRSWTTPAEIDLVTSSAHTEVLRNGDVFLAYGDLSGHFTSRRATVGAVLRTPDQRWNDPARELVYDSGTGDQANPAAVEVRPGRVLVIGFDSAAGTLVGTFVAPHLIRQPSPDHRRVDLAAWHDAGRLSVTTDLTYTDPERPGVGPLGAIDGTVGYYDAAWADHPAPATYRIDLDRASAIHQVGVALKPGYSSAALVEVRNDGEWLEAGRLDDRVRWGDDLTWFRVHGPIDSVRVTVTGSDGWAVLAEVGIRAPGGHP